MTKFSLIPNPTFSVTASIPRAGAEDGKLTFTFRHKTLDELRAMDEQLQKKAEGKKASIEPQADYLMEIVEGWALPDEFTRDNVIVLLKNYPRAFDSIGLAYTKELMGTKTSEDDEVVTWSLSSPADLQNLVIPTRQITSMCEWALRGQYRSGDGCTYNGTAYFDAKGNSVADPALDVCGGCLSDCRKRFGAGLAEPNTAILDFGGFPATVLFSR